MSVQLSSTVDCLMTIHPCSCQLTKWLRIAIISLFKNVTPYYPMFPRISYATFCLPRHKGSVDLLDPIIQQKRYNYNASNHYSTIILNSHHIFSVLSISFVKCTYIFLITAWYCSFHNVDNEDFIMLTH
ncbi:hypothetical protein BDC45DRAFT_540452 [Circinella umbellata]|nr:hypothetical protein BDC45DRAFT_540452 [Circinella umbellata]